MNDALCETVIDGIQNNRELQIELISEPAFRDGSYTTDFVNRYLEPASRLK